MAVVKADGYGHGLVPSARAALAGGATWLGTAIVDEALALRAAGITVPLLSWLWTPDEAEAVAPGARRRHRPLGQQPVAAGRGLAAVRESGTTARVHLKIDTGLSRNGQLRRRLARAGRRRRPRRRRPARSSWSASWSHFAYADEPGHPTIDRADRGVPRRARRRRAGRRRTAAAASRELGRHAHPARTPTSISSGRASRCTACRRSPGDYGLTPAMTLRAGAAGVKRVRAGEGVSYGHEYTTARDHHAGAGAAGLRRRGAPARVQRRSGLGQRGALHRGRPGLHGPDRRRRGRSSGGARRSGGAVRAGSRRRADRPGLGRRRSGTIHYEIVTRIGPRVQRVYRE